MTALLFGFLIEMLSVLALIALAYAQSNQTSTEAAATAATTTTGAVNGVAVPTTALEWVAYFTKVAEAYVDLKKSKTEDPSEGTGDCGGTLVDTNKAKEGKKRFFFCFLCGTFFLFGTKVVTH
jgi:uncharacterized low-complexity protein